MIRISTVTFAMLVGFTSAIAAQDAFLLGKSATAWTAQLRHSEPEKRRAAAFALGKIGAGAVFSIDAMRTALTKEANPKVKDSIVFALAEICRQTKTLGSDTQLETALLGALTDGDPQVRRSAAYALGCQKPRSVRSHQALDKALEDQVPMVRQNAAWALSQFGESALPSIRRALRDPDSLVKRDAASALLLMKDGDKVHDLLRDLLPLCRDTNSEVQRAALNVLVRIVDPKDRDAIPSLRWALDTRDIENRRNAALALSNIGGEETAIAVPVLLEAAQNGDAEVRHQAVIAIRNIGPAAHAAVPALIRLLGNDGDATVREHAALALGGIRAAAAPALDLLVRKIDDKSEALNVRVESAMAVARIGQVDTAIQHVPTLLKVLADPRQETKLRERVMWALRVHGAALRKMDGPLVTFTKVLIEPLNGPNKMLRYDCAYMLGMIWQQQAPDQTLDVLHEFLNDNTIQIFDSTSSVVGGASAEGKTGTANVKEQGKGDGRIMAVDALRMMGPTRYAPREDIMRQLRVLAADNAIYPPLQKKAKDMVKTAG